MSPFVDWRIPCDRGFYTDLNRFSHLNNVRWGNSDERINFVACFHDSNPINNEVFSSEGRIIKGDEKVVNAMHRICNNAYRLYVLIKSGAVTQFSFAIFRDKVQLEYELPDLKRMTFCIIRDIEDDSNKRDDRIDYVNRIKPLFETLFATLGFQFDKSKEKKRIKRRTAYRNETITLEVYKLRNAVVTAPIPTASAALGSEPKSS